ncbi:NAD(P)/FAD-dependent oxidoreductase [Blastococcus tunisiensis]|uniref:Sulfide:quinone oxidoreductase n=1 Tax=Blastococcus tunisiensis TaxID=1798228 RepID=A0A1I2LYE3_9ACTN|nr:FAD/NAD(P)-binding oxidoreductase [Blastococcus sp. DSM 46838]SFF84194.1 sulfide:quinone oxidoreductase [Blastococcus sp. DSM 46838]
MPPTDAHHEVLIVGGGTAGISVAARLRRAGQEDVGIIEPATTHYYQPLWTLVGGGRAPIAESARPEATVMPKGTDWIQDAAEDVDPVDRRVFLRSGRRVTYDHLVVAPGIQLDWDRVPGMTEALDTPQVASNYTYGLAPKTWSRIRAMRSGTAVFTMPAGPIKCAGAPQKIAYLAADHWREQGVLKDIRIVLVLPTPAMFGVKVFSDELDRVVARYGIEVHLDSEVTEIDGEGRSVIVTDNANGTKEAVRYDFLHVVPPQSAPDWLTATPLADPANPNGYVEIDKETMRHVRFPEVFALGDAGSSPNSKTGAAIRKQAPVVVANLLAAMAGTEPPARYDGYASCPITTARDRMLLCEFDYSLQPHPTIPFIDTTHERYDMWLVKRYGLPAMYWNLMLRGRT